MTIGIIGCGKMGEAILTGWLHAQTGPAAAFGANDFLIVGHTAKQCESITHRYGVRAQINMDGIEKADIVVLGVKPQVLPGVLVDLAPHLEGAPHVVISIAAGVPTQTIEEALPAGVRVVRAMPNTPLQVGAGASAVAAGASATQSDLALVRDLFQSLGLAVEVAESQIDAVTALSGAAPAYFAALVEALAAAGEEVGLPRATAEALLVQSGAGTFEMMRKTGQTPEQTRVAVCSPGGTTLAALGAMEDAGFSASLAAGVQAAVRRAKELA